MFNSSTQTSLEPHGVMFTNVTAQGAQVVRVTMTLQQPTIFAACVTLDLGRLIYTPLVMTEIEIKEFFDAARKCWKDKG